MSGDAGTGWAGFGAGTVPGRLSARLSALQERELRDTEQAARYADHVCANWPDGRREVIRAYLSGLLAGRYEWDDLPGLSDAEMRALDSLPADFVQHLIAGDRAAFNPDGTFREWVRAAGN